MLLYGSWDLTNVIKEPNQVTLNESKEMIRLEHPDEPLKVVKEVQSQIESLANLEDAGRMCLNSCTCKDMNSANSHMNLKEDFKPQMRLQPQLKL